MGLNAQVIRDAVTWSRSVEDKSPTEKVLVFDESKSPNFLQYFEFIARHHFAKLDGITIPESLNGKYFKVKNGVLTDITSAGQSYLAGQGRNGVLVLPSSITRIDNGVFTQRFQNFKAIYAEGVTEVGSFAFNETGSLNFAHLPKLKKLGEAVFTDNASLTAVNFPLLEEIGDVCFTGGANFSGNGLKITYVSIPAAKKIGSGAFHGNYKHSGVTFILGAQPEVNTKAYEDYPQEGFVAFGQLKSPVLYVTPEHLKTYTLTDGKWHGFTVKELK